MKKIVWNFIFVFCCLSFSACGGGGGGDSTNNAAASTIAVAVATSGNATVGNTGPGGGAALVGNTVILKASDSYDLQGKALTAFSWSLTTKPAYSNATINNRTSSTASVSIDVAGDYVVQLSVTNSSGIVANTSITVKGAANPKFGPSILTLYATTTGLNGACNIGEDPYVCDDRLKPLIHLENLGCLTCDATQADSICNFNGKYGSLNDPKSIWNTGANQYGDPSNQSSPWNSTMISADQGPILRLMPILQTAFNDRSDLPIAFTLNAENYWIREYLPDAVKEPLLLDMLAAYSAADPSPTAQRDAVCSALSKAMQ
jgi:hypothetical protein